MKITAKYPGMCPKCGTSIQVGDQVEWEKGTKPTHASCPKALQQAAPLPGSMRQVAARKSTCDCLGLGWVHIQERQQVQRCDRCCQFGTDVDAGKAHARDCGCGWFTKKSGPIAKQNGAGQKVLSRGIPLASRFDGTCKGCKQPYGAGSSVVWYGKGGGTFHALCDPGGSTDRSKPRSSNTRQEDLEECL